MNTTNRRDDRGFTLVEVLLVLVIVSILTVIMIYTASGARSVATANQSLNVANQNARYAINMMERDLRQAGSGLYTRLYMANNEGSDDPGEFDNNYKIADIVLDGFTLPPLEVINGTNDDPDSFFLQFALSLGTGGGGGGGSTAVPTSNYREPGSDVVTLFFDSGVGFEGDVDEYQGTGQEHADVLDITTSDRLLRIWDEIGQTPLLIFVTGTAIDKDGVEREFGTFKVVTNVRDTGSGVNIDFNPSNDVNAPTNLKGLFESLGLNFQGDPDALRRAAEDSQFLQISAATYFVYRHPTIADARGWLVRADVGAVTSGIIDLTDPASLRPFVLADNVVDLQVAIAIDSNENGRIDNGEWHNNEDMEDYIQATSGTGTASANFTDMVNNLKAVRFSVVTYTDQMSEDDAVGFVDRNSSDFYAYFPTVEEVAEFIGISPTLEDHSWLHGDLADRLWYRHAAQHTRLAIVRNLDLENTFARTEQ